MTDLALQQQNVLGDMDGLDRIVKFSELMATARASLPRELQGNPGDCLAVCLQSAAWQMNPFAVAQKTHFIKGKLGYEAQLVNAVITRHAPVQERLQFRWSQGWEKILGRSKTVQGDKGPYQAPNWNPEDERDLWCEVSGTLNTEADPRVTRVLMVQAHPRMSTQWATDPKQQLAYVAIKKWARLHCPDVILGIYTPEEIQNREQPVKDVTPADELQARLDAQGETLTARKASDSPSARTATDRPDGEELASTETTPTDHVKETTPTEDEIDDDDRAARIQEKLRAQNQVALAKPTDQDRATLQMALDSIASCNSVAQLEECGKDLQDTLHPELKGKAAKVYKEKRGALES